tara:strand:- start:3516 stop:4622 length:1107 start_codon:yes stop_codon:yes gene_type:complete
MKKIVILTDSICKIGGIESLINLKANYWVTKRDYTIHIITTEQQGRKPLFDMNPKIKLHDLSLNYDRNSSYFGPKNLLKVFKNYFRLQKKLDAIEPDFIIIANHIPVTFFFTFLRTKAKFIKEFHFSKYNRAQNRNISLFRKYENYLETKYDHLVVLNPEERAFYNTPNTVTIPNPIADTFGKEPMYNNRDQIAMAAGRITPVKRFDVLIDIWSVFVKQNKDWQLVIYGDGEESYVNFLKEKTEVLHISANVTFMGSVKNIQAKMKDAGLYLMTSSQECFPMVLLEAQSSGLPIIAFDCPTGPRNIITNNEDGILVPLDDHDKFVSQLIALTNDEELRIHLAKNGYKNSKQYAIDEIMAIWDEKVLKN